MRTPKEPDRGHDDWKPWAADRLEELRAEVTALHGQVSQERHSKEALQKKSDEQEQAVRGLEAWVSNRRKKALDVMAVGSMASLTNDVSVACRIVGLVVDAGGVRYRASWWANGQRFEGVLDPCEISPIEETDYLPLNPLDRMPVGGYKETM